MSIATIKENTVYILEGEQFRLHRQYGQNWQIVHVASGDISTLSIDELMSMYSKGTIQFPHLENPQENKSNQDKNINTKLSELPEELRTTLINRRHFIMQHLEENPSSRSIKDIETSLKKYWLPVFGARPDAITVIRWTSKFLDGNKNIFSLMPDNAHKGNYLSRFPQKVMELAHRAIEEIYMTTDRATIKSTHDKLALLIIEENYSRPEFAKLRVPSIKFLRGLISAKPKFEVDAARYGKEYARRKYKNCLGSAESGYPMRKFEIDHTQLDVIVVDENGNPLGRPWMTTVFDTEMKCLMGYHLTLDPPCSASVGKALMHAILPKSERKINDAVKGAYPMHGLPEMLMLDNAFEFHGGVIEDICCEYGIQITYSRRRTPTDKAGVERVQGTVNRILTEFAQGKTFSSPKERADNKPHKEAKLTMEIIEQALQKAVVDIYHQTTHRSLGRTPLAAWEKFAQSGDIRLPGDVKRLKILTAEKMSRTIQNIGITIDYISYNSDEIGELVKFKGNGQKVEVRRLEEDLGQIWVKNHKGEFIEVPASKNWIQYAKGLKKNQHESNRKFIQNNNKDCNTEEFLRAKEELRLLVKQDLKRRKNKSSKKHAQYLGEDIDPIESAPIQVPTDNVVASIPDFSIIVENEQSDVPDFEPIVNTRAQFVIRNGV